MEKINYKFDLYQIVALTKQVVNPIESIVQQPNFYYDYAECIISDRYNQDGINYYDLVGSFPTTEIKSFNKIPESDISELHSSFAPNFT